MGGYYYAQSPVGATCVFPPASAFGLIRLCSCEICYCGRPSAEEGAIGVVGLERDGGRIEREMASDGRVDWLSRATGWRNREDEGGASRLLVAEAAEAETLSAQVP